MSMNSYIPNHAAAVVLSDTTSQFGHALYCGSGGTVILETSGGETVTFTVPTGGVIIQQFTKVKAGGSATNLVRQWLG